MTGQSRCLEDACELCFPVCFRLLKWPVHIVFIADKLLCPFGGECQDCCRLNRCGL